METALTFQQIFFNQLTHSRGKTHNILKEVMEVLDIKKGAAYKRISGETSMSMDEIVKLANHFSLSLDSIYREDKLISFYHPFVKQEKITQNIFLNQFRKFFDPLRRKTSNEPIELTYLANELPIFYYFGHKYIFNFLMSVWRHLHWDDAKLEISDRKDMELHADAFRSDAVNYYYGHKVTEIWNSNMLNNLYQQVIFAITIRAFKEAVYVNRLIKDIENLINHLREVSISGVKSIRGADVEGSELKIYLNDFGNYLNIVQYESEAIKSTFIGYDYPQFIVSNSTKFFNFSGEWINKLKKRSVLISTEGYQYRELFFIKMETDFTSFKTKVNKLMSIYYESEV